VVTVMAFVIFVGGLLPFDSGKTTLSAQLLSALSSSYPLRIAPFKPLSGSNLYYHYTKLKEYSSRFNSLISLDIVELLSHLSSDISNPSLFNPVHRLHTPAVPYYFFTENSLKTYYSRFTNSIPLIQRFTIVEKENKFKTHYIINEQAYSNNKFLNDSSLISSLLKEADGFYYYRDEQEYYVLNEQYYAEATNSTFEYLKAHYPVILIEGFNNAAHPAWCVREANIILLVGPGTVFVYEPEPYFRAIDSYRSVNRDKPSTTEDIVNLQKPNKAFALPVKEEEQIKQINNLAEEIYQIFSKIDS